MIHRMPDSISKIADPYYADTRSPDSVPRGFLCHIVIETLKQMSRYFLLPGQPGRISPVAQKLSILPDLSDDELRSPIIHSQIRIHYRYSLSKLEFYEKVFIFLQYHPVIRLSIRDIT